MTLTRSLSLMFIKFLLIVQNSNLDANIYIYI
uniref:Uncharacterized protein n=1 Tax=Rhizophora mucronata TaxID=61149 RepID=A0A2P2PWR8_RHIMU